MCFAGSDDALRLMQVSLRVLLVSNAIHWLVTCNWFPVVTHIQASRVHECIHPARMRARMYGRLLHARIDASSSAIHTCVATSINGCMQACVRVSTTRGIAVYTHAGEPRMRTSVTRFLVMSGQNSSSPRGVGPAAAAVALGAQRRLLHFFSVPSAFSTLLCLSCLPPPAPAPSLPPPQALPLVTASCHPLPPPVPPLLPSPTLSSSVAQISMLALPYLLLSLSVCQCVYTCVFGMPDGLHVRISVRLLHVCTSARLCQVCLYVCLTACFSCTLACISAYYVRLSVRA